jgi:NAD(P)H dehydrogenase (quinone)
MYAVMGITGQVGSVVAESLLFHGEKVRAIVRDSNKAAALADRGVEMAAADYDDAIALETAFREVKGVFIMIPPNFAPSPDFREARQTIDAIGTALDHARPERIVYLSSIGAQQTSGLGLITALHLLEEKLDSLSIPSAALRAGWFMENSAWDIAPAREQGKLFSYLQPLDREFALVGTQDIGRIGAKTLLESWQGHRKLEVAGPRRYTPNNIATALSAVLHKSIDPVAVPRETWVSNFVSQGTPENRTALRVEMLDAFNSGWIDFEIPGTEHITGKVELEEVIQSLAARAR